MQRLKNTYNTISGNLERFLYSYAYIALVTLIGAWGFIFKQEFTAIVIVTVILSIQWVFVKDILPSLLGAMILGMIPLARYGEVDYFLPLFWVLTYVVPAWIIHMIIYPPKFIKGRFFYPTLAIAISITLGGLFSPYFLDSFKGASLYYLSFLGFGMVMIYVFVENYLPNRKDAVLYFSKMMLGVGIMGILMVSSYYYYNWDDIVNNGGLGRYFQWRNNLSNNLLLSMPFAFYLAYKNKYVHFYYLIGVLQFVALVMSFSRGGIIFGTLVFPFLVTTMFILKPKKSLGFITILVLVFGAVYFMAEEYFDGFMTVINDIRERVQISPDEARANMLRMAWENFKNYPVFGTGFGFSTAPHYNPQPMAMYWYHTTIGQIVGSLGLMGIIAYTYQMMLRGYTLIEKRTVFNLFVAFSIMGFAGYSMVNVGYFIPLPMVAVVIQIFILAERNNRFDKASSN